MTELAVVSLSGGLDSCVTTAIARGMGFDLALLHADYGQLTESRERQAFHDIANFYAVPLHHRLVISFENLRKIGGSALTDSNIALQEGDLVDMEIEGEGDTGYSIFSNSFWFFLYFLSRKIQLFFS